MHRMLPGLMALCALAGCSTAEVARRSGPVHVGEIVGSDTEYVYVQETSGLPAVAIPRADIVDIQHPGTPMNMVGWTIIALYSPFSLAGVALLTGNDPDAGFALTLTGGFMSAIGAGFVLYGWGQGRASRERVTQGLEPEVTLSPIMTHDAQGRARAGVGFSGRF